jgi:hypothetical protein
MRAAQRPAEERDQATQRRRCGPRSGLMGHSSVRELVGARRRFLFDRRSRVECPGHPYAGKRGHNSDKRGHGLSNQEAAQTYVEKEAP